MVKALLSPTGLAALALTLAVFAFAAPAAAEAAAPTADAEVSETDTRRDPSDLTPKEMKAVLSGLDKTDPAVRFARAMQRDGLLFVGGGVALAGISLGVAVVDDLSGTSRVGPYVASLGVPMAMGLLVVGIPNIILSSRLLGWYGLNGPAPSSMARLKLLRRWRLQSLLWMRDGSLLGTAITGAAGLFSAVAWAARDAQGLNGEITDPTAYRPLDATTSLAFLGTAAGLGVSALVWTLELKEERDTPHRLFAMPSVHVSPVLAGPTAGMNVSAGLVLVF
jgi:hypothetical protein